MISTFGDFDTTETVVIPFNTFDSNDPSASVTLTNLAAGDVHIHKDGGLTQRSSAAGVVVDVDVDGIAGCHWVTIDLSDNTDAGFYADGSQYSVRIEGVTVDAGTINPWIGAFTIGRMLRPTTAGRTLDVSAGGEAGIDWANIGSPTTAQNLSATNIDVDQVVASVSGAVGSLTGHTVQTGDTFALANGATGFAAIDTVVDGIQTDLSNATDGLGAIKAETALIVADTNELQTDWADGGRLDLILDAASAPTAAAVADAVWDEAQADHVGAGTFGEVATEVANILADTNELQTDDVPGLISTLDAVVDTVKAETALILTDTTLIVADTNELQSDDYPTSIAALQTDLDTLTAGVNVTQIAGVTAAATGLSLSADAVESGTASGTPTTTTMVSDLAVTVNDQFKSRIIIFADDTTTAALRGQATDITGCTAASNTLTFTALTTAPVSGDTYIII